MKNSILEKTKAGTAAKKMSGKTTSEKIQFVIDHKLNIVFSTFFHQGWTRVHNLSQNKEIKFNDVSKESETASYYMDYIAIGRKNMSETDKKSLINHAEGGYINKTDLSTLKSYLKNNSNFA